MSIIKLISRLNMYKFLIILIAIPLFFACNTESRHFALIQEIMKNPEKIDSICSARGYKFECINKENYKKFLKRNNDIEYSSSQTIDKGYDGVDIEWQIITVKTKNYTNTVMFEFYFKRTKNNEWVLFYPTAIYD